MLYVLGDDVVHVSKGPYGEGSAWNRLLALTFNRQSANITSLDADVKDYDYK